jgi:hypothetical protein
MDLATADLAPFISINPLPAFHNSSAQEQE